MIQKHDYVWLPMEVQALFEFLKTFEGTTYTGTLKLAKWLLLRWK